jgi:uncharacterized protein (TIGR03435 family)
MRRLLQEALKPETLGMSMSGSFLPQRIQRMLHGLAAQRVSRVQLVIVTVASLAMAVIFSAGSLVRAQTKPEAGPAFEVASIKPSKDPEPGGTVEITPGRFEAKDFALQWLILTAYKIKSENLSGDLPSWTIDERYTIDAKTEGVIGEDQTLSALQNLLKARFQLKEHREIKTEPVYFLTIGKSGIKMPRGSCVPVKKDFPNECWSQGRDGLIRTLDWRGVSMSASSGVAYQNLAWQLAAAVKRPVIDKTGLSGTYDVHLRWLVDPAPGDAPGPSPELGVPSIADALEKQLGLKLESGRGPVEYLVVDHVERPSEN